MGSLRKQGSPTANKFGVDGILKIDRRTFLSGVAGTFVLANTSTALLATEKQKSGGQANLISWPPPQYLTTAFSTAEIHYSSKFFDGLLTYGFGMEPQPCLAESWDISADGKRIVFHLRKGVKWHDGNPFTSKDVAYTIMELTKVHHGRGRVTFASVVDVETPDDHTAIFVMSAPAPAVMKSLNSIEVPIMPEHLYKGTDILKNPYNTKPVGTGAWKLLEYKVGESLVMERNPDYWREGEPHIDILTIQIVGDAATRSALLESGAVDIVPHSMVPLSDVKRLDESDALEVSDRGYETMASMNFMDFRLDHEILGKKEVRKALAHAISPAWVAENVWYGYSKAATGPIHQDHSEYYTTDGVPSYPLDLAKAEQMLDAAGHPRGTNGVRFELTMAPSPWGDEPLRTAEYIREQFRQIGISMTIETGDMGAFVKRVYTDRAFDVTLVSANSGPDPVIGMHRFYKSTSFKKGVGFSNASGFKNEEADALLSATEAELDRDKRREQYKRFQQIVMEELPSLPIIAVSYLTVANSRVRDHTVGAVGAIGSMAEAWVEA